MERVPLRDWELLKAALEREGLEGVEWEPLALDVERHPDLRHRATECVRLRFLVPYDDPHRLRTIVAHIVDRGVWVDVLRLAILPFGHTRRFGCAIDLVFADPLRAFQSPLVRKRLAATAKLERQYQAVAEALMGEFERCTSKMSDEDRAQFRGRLEAYLQGGFYTGREAEAAAFEDALDEKLRPIMLDLRLYVDLPRSHRHLLESVDHWIEQERALPQGGARGRTIHRSPWPAFVPSSGVNETSEIHPGRPPRSYDPAPLFEIVANEGAAQSERQDALFKLHELTTDEARRYWVRSLGYPTVRLNALVSAITLPWMAPLYREIVLSDDCGRISRALDRLRDFDADYEDPLDAWRRAEPGGGAPDGLGALYQDAILQDYARSGDRTVVPAIVERLRIGERSESWIRAALIALREFGAAEAADAVLPYVEHEEPLVRQAAMEFFRVADHPPAVPALLLALEKGDVNAASASEQGLSGQPRAGWDPLLGALEKLHRRAIAIPSRSPDDFHRNHLGATLIHTLAALPGRCPNLEPVRRTARRIGAESSPDVRRLLGESDPEREFLREPQLSGFEPRIQLWSQKGYAARRYREDGHRSPEWDGFVDRAFALYDPARQAQDPEVARSLGEAVRRGCRDGMVHYRLAICHHLRGNLEAARESYRQALELLPERYPKSAYELCAAAALGQMARNEGHSSDALGFYRRAIADDMAAAGVRDQIPDIEEEVRFLREEGREPMELGLLLPVPGRRHPAKVSSLELSPDGFSLLSADEEGWIQVSRIVEDSSPALEPQVRGRAHGSGRTLAAWVSLADRRFVTAGADGRVRLSQFRARRVLEFKTVLEHGRPIVAVVRASDTQVAFADDGGNLFFLDLDARETTGLPTAWLARIRKLLCDGTRLVAIDEERGVQVWALPAGGAPVWTQRIDPEIVFADVCESGLLYLGTNRETVLTYKLESGRPMKTFTATVGHEPPRFGRFEVASGVAVWAYASGGIRVEANEPGGGLHAVTEPVAALDVNFKQRVVAHADAHGFLHVHAYGG